MDSTSLLTQLPALTAWDYAVGTVFLLSTAFGLFRGFISTVFGLFAWAAGVFSAWLLAPQLAVMLELDAPTVLLRIGLFFIVYLAVRVLGYVLARVFSAAGLGGLDKPLGALFGALRAFFIVAVVVVALQWSGTARWVSWDGSACQGLLDAIAQWARESAPARERPGQAT